MSAFAARNGLKSGIPTCPKSATQAIIKYLERALGKLRRSIGRMIQRLKVCQRSGANPPEHVCYDA
jgi:hypothetical protein